jgi:hypothetical protein
VANPRNYGRQPAEVTAQLRGDIFYRNIIDLLAEREGFEPPIGLHLCRISSAVHSTTLPPLRGSRYWRSPARSGRVLGEDGWPDKAPAA